MKDKKLQVFVSSTYSDLKEERQAAVEAILSSGNIPAGMELFSAGDESQMTVIKRWIDESDVYLLILGGRYGSIDLKSNKSYTHLEYEYALKQKKPLFAVVVNEKALEDRVKEYGSSVLEQDFPKELKLFRAEALKNLVKFWDDKKDIKIAIHETISEFSYRKELVGWTRGIDTVNNAVLVDEIARLTKENSSLRDELNLAKENSTKFLGIVPIQNIEEILKNEKIKLKDKEITLLEGLNEYADTLAVGYYNPPDDAKIVFNRLALYKLVEEYGGSDVYAYRFTREGHSLYLNALFKNEK